MSSPILVTGGTGTLGQLVIPQLLNAGCVVRVLSRHPRDGGEKAEFVPGDLNTGQGIDAAVDGTEIIVHCAGSNKGDQDKARTLVRAASQAGVRHLVNISVVGADRVPVASRLDRAMFGYFGAKLAAEQVIAGSGVPWTTLRATQFHELILMVARQMTRLPVIPFPAGFRFQPVERGRGGSPARRAGAGRAGLVPDLAGPRVYRVADLLRSYQQASGTHWPMVPVRLPGQAARAYRAGANLAPGRAVGRRTWEDFLAAQAGAAGESRSPVRSGPAGG